MRPVLAAVLLALAPACLAVPSVILVAGEDAGAPPDRAPVDASRDAPGDRAQLADVVDAALPDTGAADRPSAPVDAPPEADVADAATFPDVADGGTPGDVPVLDVVDAAPPDTGAEDRPSAPVDTPPEADVVDAGSAVDAGPCDGRCGDGALCAEGACEPQRRFVGSVRAGGAFGFPRLAVEFFDERCRSQWPTARACYPVEFRVEAERRCAESDAGYTAWVSREVYQAGVGRVGGAQCECTARALRCFEDGLNSDFVVPCCAP